MKKVAVWFLAIALNSCNSDSYYLEEYDFDNVPFGYIRFEQEKVSESRWSVGCETLDREFAIFDNYKDQLLELGIKRVRIQAGWARTEYEKGVYDFEWLDSIIDFCIENGIQPWVQLSYGNDLYVGGGTEKLGSSLPSSENALVAWDKWVELMVLRYINKIDEWEVWNEPDASGEYTEYAEFYIRTANLVRELQPNSKLYAISSSTADPGYVENFLDFLNQEQSIDLVTSITYHHYTFDPEKQYEKVAKLLELIPSYSNSITLFQGENGPPSQPGSFGALSDHDWTENAQAKWCLRRLCGDFSRNINSNIFSIIDMETDRGWNYKGLLEANLDKTVKRNKLAFYAIQNLITILSDNVFPEKIDLSTNVSDLELILLKNEDEETIGFIYWIAGGVPENQNNYFSLDIGEILMTKYFQLVQVDLLDGGVYNLSSDVNYTIEDGVTNFFSIPVSDYPIIIIDEEHIEVQ